MPAPSRNHMTVCIDVGHGKGNRRPGLFDPGCVRWSPDSKSVAAAECDIALAYAIALQDALGELGVPAELTRVDNVTDCSLQQRVSKARRMKADLLISLHCDASDKHDRHGHEVLWRTPASAAIARAISDALSPVIPPDAAGVVKRPDLWVLGYDPSVLVELAYIDHDGDYALLASDETKARIASLLATAIFSIFKSQGEK